MIRRARPVLVAASALVAACGARTGLIAPELADATADAADASDASHENDAADAADASDAPADHPADVLPDAPPAVFGCADGQREGFVDAKAFPDIAGCSGGWGVPGVMAFDPGFAPACPTYPTHDTTQPACNRQAGDDGPNPNGAGCDVADLCEAGWHVCAGAADVASHAPGGTCAGAVQSGDPPMFFVTRQSSNGCGDCATGTSTGPSCNSAACVTGCAQSAWTSNDVFGCGNLGATSPLVDCQPLDRFSNNLCGDVGSNWSCTDDGSGLCEAYAIVHVGSTFGGALCCRD